MKNLLVSLILILSPVGSSAQTDNVPLFITDSLDSYIKKEMKNWNIPGLAVAIVKNGKIIHMKGYGIKSIESKEKIDENTLFQIGSITKSFTATAASILHVEKKFSLNDKVNKWLPYFKLKDSLISNEANIIDLLSHRLGFESYKGDLVSYLSNFDRKNVVEKMALLDINRSFRSSYGYSNSAYTAVGEVIEKVAKKPWKEFISEKILKPLEMKNTVMVYNSKIKYPNISLPHTVINGDIKLTDFNPTENIAPAGSMLSSVKDLSHWLIAQIYNGKYNKKQAISSRAIRITRRPFTIQGFDQSKNARTHFYTYGLGFFVRDINGVLTYQHSGGLTGFSTNHIIIPEEELGVVVLTNTDHNNFYIDLTNVIVDAFLRLPFEDYSANSLKSYYEEMKLLDKEKDSLKNLIKSNKYKTLNKKYIGTYKNDSYGEVKIIEESGKLKLLLLNQDNLYGILENMSNNKFLCTFSNYEFGTVILPFNIKNESVVMGFNLLIENIEGNVYKFLKVKQKS